MEINGSGNAETAEIIHPENLARSVKHIKKILMGAKTLNQVENVFIKVAVTPIDVEVTATLLTYNNKPAVHVIVNDIIEHARINEMSICLILEMGGR